MVNPCSVLQPENSKPQISGGLEAIAPIIEQIEASVLSVGIPLLLPSQRTKQLRAGSFRPTDDYIRSSLVGITTAELENFRLQLISDRNPTIALNQLGFTPVNFLERFGLPTLIAASTLVVTVVTALTPLCLPVFGLALVLASRSRDGFRRYSFIRLTQQEISRRSGTSQTETTGPIPISSSIAKAAS